MQVQVLSASPNHATMNVTSSVTGENFTLTVWKIGDRWFATSFAGGNGQSTAQSSTPPTSAPAAPSTIPATPDLFVSTAATPSPGKLYTWPQLPTIIELDDNDWIAGITWAAGSQSASGSGTSYTDLSCNRPAASCPPTADGTVEFSATQPETCTVTFANPQTGNQESEQAHVYNHLHYREVSGAQPGKVVTFPSACT